MKKENNINQANKEGNMKKEITIVKKGWGYSTRFLVMLSNKELNRFKSLYKCIMYCEETFSIYPEVIWK